MYMDTLGLKHAKVILGSFDKLFLNWVVTQETAYGRVKQTQI